VAPSSGLILVGGGFFGVTCGLVLAKSADRVSFVMTPACLERSS
jgi:anaerobic glycerol-3-phosphate dehydrogenase